MTAPFRTWATAAVAAGALALAALTATPQASETSIMKRTNINPTDWAREIFNQGEVVEGAARVLTIAGQVSLQDDPDAAFGVTALHPGDMRAQFGEALSNIDAVLEGAGMTRSDLTHLRFYVTDMEAGLGNFDVFMAWIGEADVRPPQSFIEVSGLALPGLVIEIEATAATGG